MEMFILSVIIWEVYPKRLAFKFISRPVVVTPFPDEESNCLICKRQNVIFFISRDGDLAITFLWTIQEEPNMYIIKNNIFVCNSVGGSMERWC